MSICVCAMSLCAVYLCTARPNTRSDMDAMASEMEVFTVLLVLYCDGVKTSQSQIRVRACVCYAKCQHGTFSSLSVALGNSVCVQWYFVVVVLLQCHLIQRCVNVARVVENSHFPETHFCE